MKTSKIGKQNYNIEEVVEVDIFKTPTLIEQPGFVFSSLQKPTKEIIEFKYRTPIELKEIIEKEIRKCYGQDADFEIKDISVRIFK